MTKVKAPRLVEALLDHLINKKKFNVIDLAKELSLLTNRTISENKILLMKSGKVSVKTWWFIPLLGIALKNDWLPKDVLQWEYVAMKSLSANKTFSEIERDKLFKFLHELSGRSIEVFENRFNLTLVK